MTKRKTSITIHKGKQRDSVFPGMWSDNWSRYADARPLLPMVDGLWAIANNHHSKAMDRATGKPEDWETRLGVHSAMKNTRDRLRSARNAGDAATDLMEKVHAERQTLKPYEGTSSDPAEAILRQSIRQRLVQMSGDERKAFFSRPMDDRTRRSLFELPEEMSGFAHGSATYQRLYTDSMKELHGDTIERLDALDACANYTINLAAAVEKIVEAETLDAGVRPDEVKSFVAKATAAV